MFKNLRSILSYSSFGKIGRSRVEKIGRLARRSKLQRTLNVENLEERRVFAAAILNEISNDPGGADQPFEYIEIKGTPGATLPSGLYFASIEGDGAAAGTADIVVDLGGQVLGSNGMLVIKSTVGTGHTPPAATTIVVNSAFNAPAGTVTVENTSNTFALIQSSSPLTTIDYDVDNNGTLELLPAGATIVDAVGWTDAGAGDVVYGSANLFSNANAMGGATRFLNDNRPNTTAAWYAGDLSTNLAYTATVANRTANFPAGGVLTPGAPNLPGTNTAPIANADAYTMLALATLNVGSGAGVLANDTDPDGVNSILSAKLISGTTNGTLTLNDDGSFVYVNNGTVGSDTFSYQATDLNLLSSTVTVTITVDPNSNIAPSISLPTGTLSYTENDLASVIDASATVSDVDTPVFENGVLTVDFTANGSTDDRIEIRNEGTSVGQIGVVGNTVQFEGIAIGTYLGGVGTTPLAVTFNSSATIAAVQAVVRNLTYRNVSDAPSTLSRTLRAVVTDGVGGTSNESTISINVTATNDAPTLTLSRSNATYVAGGAAVGLDMAVIVTDADLTNFDTGVLTISIAANSTSDESLTIRNAGNAAGQVGVASNVVSFGGIAIGTFSGGTSGSPLVVTFNASADQAAVQEVARSIQFSTTSLRLAPLPRTITYGLTDGDGGTSSLASLTLKQSQVRSIGFQEGVDSGQGAYTGAADIALAQVAPNTAYPIGRTPAEGLLVDYNAATTNSQVLLRFDNIIGNGAGQVPAGATIVSARLVVNTNNPGDGARLHRILTTWDANTSTWNSVGGGVSTNDVQARSSAEASIGTSFGTGDAAVGNTTIGVTADVQAWVSGEANNGWLLKGWDTRTDGWAFSASEASNPAERPKLEIEWLPAGVASTSFRDGVNSYTGTVDTQLRETTDLNGNTTSNETTVTLFSDYPDIAPSNTSQILLRFDDIIGNLAGQIPAGSTIHSAQLVAASTASNAPGDGGQFFTMLQPWSDLDTWDSRVAGVTADGVEASLVANTQAGSATLSPDSQGGINNFDVTTDVQAWTSNLQANNGWAILPWTNGINGWAIQSSESTVINERPQLRVYYTPAGVTVTPMTGLNTTEVGGTASFSVVLNTPPTADVTIGLSSSNSAEGSASAASVTFTSANWDVPQVITVTGVDDLIGDGNVNYQIVTAAAVSDDLNYNGIDASNVSLSNIDNEPSVSAIAVSSLTVNSSGFDVVFNQAFDPALINLYDQAGASALADVTLSGANVGDVPGTVVFNSTYTGFTFVKSGSTSEEFGSVGTLEPDDYTVTLRSAANGFVDTNGNFLLDNSGSAAGDYVGTFTVATPAAGTVTVSIPDFARGADQAINVPNTSLGLPVVISNGNDVGGVELRVTFDPTLISITGFTTTIPGASALINTSVAGEVRVTVSTGATTGFQDFDGELEIGRFTASVPTGALYGAKEVLSLSGFNSTTNPTPKITRASTLTTIPSLSDNAVHLAAFAGDVNLSQDYDNADTILLQRFTIGANSGVSLPLQSADPLIAGDINKDVGIDNTDVILTQRLQIGTPVASVPDLPETAGGIDIAGPDPRLYIPTTLTASVSSTVTVPVRVEVTEATGIDLVGISLALSWDSTKLSFASVSLGSTLSGAGFTGLAPTVVSNATVGSLRFASSTGGAGTGNLAQGQDLVLVNFVFNVLPGAATGATTVNLRNNSNGTPAGAGTTTRLTNAALASLVLSPAPTAGVADAVDGVVTISGGALATPTVTASAPNATYTGVAYAGAGVTVTGANTPAPTTSFTYYVGTGTGGTNLGTNAPINVGTYTVVANSAANAGNNAASSAPVTFQITQKAATVTADAKSKVYGSADPALTFVATGLVGTDTQGTTATGALTRVAGENVGTYAIQQGTVSLGGNYSITYVGANLTVTQASATITADAKSKTYGGSDPALTFVATGLVNGDTQGTTATGALTRVAGENVGTYAIQQGTVSLGANYSLTYVGANLTVTQASATITADAKSKTVGNADPALTFVATGLVNGDTQSSTATGSLTRVAGETVGTYAILQGTVSLGANYSVTYVGANLTINAAPVAPTFVGASVNGADTFLNAAQRSQLTSLVLNFSSPVIVASGAFTLENLGLITAQSPEALGTSQILVSGSGTSQITLRWGAGSKVISRLGAGARGNSLVDGNWRLSIDSSKVTAPPQDGGLALAGTNNQFGASAADNFFRFYGDSNGDGKVDGTDTTAMRAALAAPTSNAAFDWDGNGTTTGGVDTSNSLSNFNKRRRSF